MASIETHAAESKKEAFTEIPIIKLLSEVKCLDYDLGKLKLFIEESELTHKIMYFSYNKKSETESNQADSIPGKSENKENSIQKNKGRASVQGPLSKKDQPKSTSEAEEGNKEKVKFTTTIANIDKIFGFCLSLLKGYRFDATVCLTFNDKDHSSSTFTYFPLDISPLFNEIVNKAHCVLFTGGTMKPKGLLEEVLKHCKKKVLSCDFPPVIPKENIHCIAVTGNKTSQDFLFNHANNSKLEANLNGVSDLLCKIELKIPGGMIVFFTSYNILQFYKDKCIGQLRLNVDRELVFDSDKAFDTYKDAIFKRKRKAILFSVMGGKLSEGINFKDDLGKTLLLSQMCHFGRAALP